ncbi:MAG: hypothetical protein U5K00_00580 [Melioribacteraceae bacterium]|nr:hypothetical protein [Melioribacteraceae bacterium]
MLIQTEMDCDDGGEYKYTYNAGTNTFVQQGTELKRRQQLICGRVKTTNGTATNYSSIASFKTYNAPGIAPYKTNFKLSNRWD